MTLPIQKKLNIVSVGTWLSSSNVGDNAIYCGIQDIFPNAAFTVFSSNPKRVKETFNVDSYAPKKNIFAILISIIKADVFLFTGGTPFYDDFFQMLYYLVLVVWAKLWRKPVIVFGVSLRKLSRTVEPLIKIILNRADYIGAREYGSMERFRHLVKNDDKVHLFPDPAFQMAPIKQNRARAIIAKLGFSNQESIVGICLRSFQSDNAFQSHHYTSRYSTETLENFHTETAKFVEFLVKERGIKVILLPMHIHAPDDDRIAARKVLDLIPKDIRENVKVIEEQFSPREVKGIFSLMDFLVGARFHSLVLAASMNIPVISVEYARKSREIMDLLGLVEFSTPLENITYERLLQNYETLIGNRLKIEKQLSMLNAKLKEIYQEEIEKMIYACN